MSNKNDKTKDKISPKKNGNVVLIIVAVVAVCLALAFTIKEKIMTTQTSETETKESTIISDGESLDIPSADITTEAAFFPVEVDGTQMEIIAVRDSQGKIRTAFNTCQVCYGSGRGYYKQSGDYLVCQNCGNRFSMDHVGVESGGCNPWPIFDEDRTETDDTISISYDFLAASKQIFTKWKTN